MLAFAGTNSGIYKFLLVLHILSAIVGLGAVMLNGLYAAQTQRRPGPAGRAVFEANLFVTQVAEYVIYLIPIFGIALIYTSDKVWKFSQTWTWLSLLLYLIAIGISHAVMKPGAKRILALMDRDGAGAEITEVGKRLGVGGAALNVIVVVILFLMIWKPGL